MIITQFLALACLGVMPKTLSVSVMEWTGFVGKVLASKKISSVPMHLGEKYPVAN